MTREQLVAVVMTLLIQTDEANNRVLVAMPTYASAALEIVQAAERAVAEEKGT